MKALVTLALLFSISGCKTMTQDECVKLVQDAASLASSIANASLKDDDKIKQYTIMVSLAADLGCSIPELAK